MATESEPDTPPRGWFTANIGMDLLYIGIAGWAALRGEFLLALMIFSIALAFGTATLRRYVEGR